MKQCIAILLIVIFGELTGTSQIITETYVSTLENPVQDATVGSAGLINTNMGGLDFFNVLRDDNTTPIVYRSFIQFDLSQIPKEAILISAKLKLTTKTNSVSNYDYSIERVNDNWTDNTITWNNQPTTNLSDILKVEPPTSMSTLQEIDVYKHVYQMVRMPFLNNGWCIKLWDESITGSDYGNSFYSSDEIDINKRPSLEITYTMPIKIEGEVTHCTPGNSDGKIDFTLSGGSSDQYHLFRLYKLDTTSTTNSGMSYTYAHYLSNSSSVMDNDIVDVDSLEPGAYVAQVYDSLSYTTPSYGYPISPGYRFIVSKHFFIGREGETTNVIFTREVEHMNVSIDLDDPSANSEYKNLHGTTGGSNIRTAFTGTNSLAPGSTLAYKVESYFDLLADFPPDLDFQSVQLIHRMHATYQHSQSSNATKLIPCTSDWDPRSVTWNYRPNLATDQIINLPKTSNPNGYTHTDDTINIKPLVEYWQTNPNYGFLISLEDYNSTKTSFRQYRDFSKISQGRFEASFSVKPPKVNASVSVTNESIIVSTEGGVAPYTYLWSNGETTKDLLDVDDGIYWVKIWDAENLMTKYEISKSENAIWGVSNCITEANGVQEYTTGCSNATGVSESAASQHIPSNENGWFETQLTREVGPEKAIGISESGKTINNISDIDFGFYFNTEGTINIIKNGVITTSNSGGYEYKDNDFIKLEKTTGLSFKLNGKEIDYYSLSELNPVPSFKTITALKDGASFDIVRYGTEEDDFVPEPCTIDFENCLLPYDSEYGSCGEFDEEGNLVLKYNCDDFNRPIQVLPYGYYYDWQPDVGIRSLQDNGAAFYHEFDIDPSHIGLVYTVRVYNSAGDLELNENNFCNSFTVVWEGEGEDCVEQCGASAEIILEQPTYCEGDVLQFNIDLGSADFYTCSQQSSLNCDNYCLDPQLIVGSSGDIIFDFFYFGEDGTTENPVLCKSETFSILVDNNCFENTGISFNNYGSYVHLEEDGVNETFINMHCNYLNEKVLIDGTTIESGKIVSEGKIRVEKNWTNNGETTVFETTNFAGGKVEFFGGKQFIKGTHVTSYNDVELSGSDKKELLIDSEIRNTLNLNSIEFSTRDKTLYVTNPLTNAISDHDNGNSYGFISSNLSMGYLNWKMSAENSYFVPLGSSITGAKYKPIEVALPINESGDFNMRMVNYNPAYDQLEEKAPDIAEISDQYFYYIEPTGVSEADLTIHFNTVTDDGFQQIGHWDNVWAPNQPLINQSWWEKTTDISINTSLGYPLNNKSVTTAGWTSFDGKQFVPAKAGFMVNWNEFGQNGSNNDGGQGGGDIIVNLTTSSGVNTGGGLGNQHQTNGGGDGTGVYTPNPLENTYHLNITSTDGDCMTEGIIEFQVNTSGDIVENSVFYILDNTPGSVIKKPLADDLYNIGPTSGSNNGMFSIFSIPEESYVCDNNIRVKLSQGIVLNPGLALEIEGLTPDFQITSLSIHNSQQIDVTTSIGSLNTDQTIWSSLATAPPGVYKFDIDVNDISANSPTSINLTGIFIIK